MVIYIHIYICENVRIYMYKYAHAYTLLSLLTALLSSNKESVLEKKNSLEDDVWASGVSCGIGNPRCELQAQLICCVSIFTTAFSGF